MKTLDEFIKEILNANRQLKEENRKAKAKGQIEILDKLITKFERYPEDETIRKVIKHLYENRLIVIMEYSKDEEIANQQR